MYYVTVVEMGYTGGLSPPAFGIESSILSSDMGSASKARLV